MQTRLIEVVPDSEGWMARGSRLVQDHPFKAVAAVSATPIVAIGAIPTVATLGGVVVASALIDLWRGVRQIKQVQMKDASLLRDPDGDLPVVNQIYAVHPNRSLENIVIPASSFHSMMVAEQMADIVAFIRGTVAAAEIRIAVYSEIGAKVAVGANVEAGDLDIKAHAGSARHHSVDLHYDRPEIVALEETPFWMKAFPEVISAFRGATKGSVRRSVSVDTSFGLSASLARAAGMDANWLGRQMFEIQAEFG